MVSYENIFDYYFTLFIHCDVWFIRSLEKILILEIDPTQASLWEMKETGSINNKNYFLLIWFRHIDKKHRFHLLKANLVSS